MTWGETTSGGETTRDETTRGKRLGGETTRGGNGLGAKRPGFVSILDKLETAIGTASSNQDTIGFESVTSRFSPKTFPPGHFASIFNPSRFAPQIS